MSIRVEVSVPHFSLLGVKYLLSVHDMKRAIQFYQSLFPLVLCYDSAHFSELRFDSFSLGLHMSRVTGFRKTSLSFTVDDIHRACGAVLAAGGRMASEPEDRGNEGIILAELVDTEGNGFMLSQNK